MGDERWWWWRAAGVVHGRRSSVPAGARSSSADRGLDFAHALGPHVAVAVGDSTRPRPGPRRRRGGRHARRSPSRGEGRDGSRLALDVAVGLGPGRLVVIAGGWRPAHHALSALLLLASQQYARSQVDAVVGLPACTSSGASAATGRPGSSSRCWRSRPAEDVVTDGLVYPLRGRRSRRGRAAACRTASPSRRPASRSAEACSSSSARGR